MGRPPLNLSNGTKHCARCKQTLPLKNFSKSSSTIHGYQTYCKDCMYARHKEWAERPDNRKKLSERLRKARAKDPERFRDYDLRSNHKVPPGTYKRMYDAQNGKCAICEREDGGQKGKFRFHLDHCHDTGVIRGLLCHNCNVGIGNLRHDEKLLHRAVEYLRRFSRT